MSIPEKNSMHFLTSAKDMALLKDIDFIGNHTLLDLHFTPLLSGQRLNFQIFALYLNCQNLAY
jgi:hypothetical protein